MGIICGPYVFKLIDFQQVKNLQLLDGLALSLIALTAGGELKIKSLGEKRKAIFYIILFQTLLLIGGFIVFTYIGKSLFYFLASKNIKNLLAFSLLLGVLTVATSPSTTIAVITETRAKGKLTDLVLSITVIKDLVVIILFAFFLSFSRFLMSSKGNFNFSFFLHLIEEMGGSIITGLVIGFFIIVYLKYIKSELTVFILAIAFFTYQLASYLGFHPLLICMIAGFLTENFSSEGEKLILTIEKSSLPIYVIFFAISGASLNLEVLKNTWFTALIIVIFRGVLKFFGTYIGAKFSKEEKIIQNLSWMGFISQAGVALGMVIIIERTFPQWGSALKSLILAVIAINQIIGPVFLQKIIYKAGEAGKKEF
jgi:Kef-type K+ transport system membrane component KefB